MELECEEMSPDNSVVCFGVEGVESTDSRDRDSVGASCMTRLGGGTARFGNVVAVSL